MAKLYANYCFKEWTRRMELFQRGSSNADSFWEYLDVIESDYVQLLFETSYLIAIFMMNGRTAFHDIDHKSKNESTMLLSEYTTKYIIEESKTHLGFQIGILYLVSRHPLAVAHHLKRDEDLHTYGDLNGLPKSLAFRGGIFLIPESKEWEPLMILWKIWMSFFTRVKIDPITTEYLLLEYHLPKRFNPMAVMKFLDIEVPDRFEVLCTLEKLITKASGIDVVKENINICMEKMFKQFSGHISYFYWTNILEFGDIASHIIPRSKGAKHSKSQKGPIFFRPVSKSKENRSYQNVRKETLISSKTNTGAQQDKVAFTHSYCYPVQGSSSQQKALPCIPTLKVSKRNESPERESETVTSELPRKLSSFQYSAIRFRSVPILKANRWIEILEQTQSECDTTDVVDFQKRTLKLPQQVSPTQHLFKRDQRLKEIKDGKKSEKTIREPSAPTRQKYIAGTTLQKGLSDQLAVNRSKHLVTPKGNGRFEKSNSVSKQTSCKKGVEWNSSERVRCTTTTWKSKIPERSNVVKGQESRNCATKDPVKGRSQTSNRMKLLFLKN